MQVAQRPEIGRVGVPRRSLRIAIGHRRPVQLHHAGSGLHQPPRHQGTLAKGEAPVLVAHVIGLQGQVEGIARLARQHEVEGVLVVLVERVTADGLVQCRHRAVDAPQQLEAALQSLRRNFLPQFQVIELDLLVRILVEPIRVVRLADEARRTPLADHAGLLQWTRQFHERQHRVAGRAEFRDPRAGRGEVVRRGRLELAGGGDLGRLVTRQHLIDGGSVIEQPGRRVAHRTDQRALVDRVRQHRHRLAEVDAGNLRLDLLEFPAHVRGRIRLGIPYVDMRRAALQEEHDDRLGGTEAGRAVIAPRAGRSPSLVLQPQHVLQRQSEQAERTDLHQIPACRTIAESSEVTIRNCEHG